MPNIDNIEEYAQTNPQVLVVNKATGEVAAEYSLKEFAEVKQFTGDMAQVATWITNHPMTVNMFVYRFKDAFDPHESWPVHTENHPILIYDIITRKAVVSPSLSAACKYLNVSDVTLNQALKGKKNINSRYVCIPIRQMGQFSKHSKEDLWRAAMQHLYIGQEA